MNDALEQLCQELEGDVFTDETMKTLYATDASPYQEMPLGVFRPKHAEDIRKIIEFANMEGVSLIPRTAGTSLAGQCVGNGYVVDVSKYMTAIIELNEKEKWIRLEPGVIRDELNHYLNDYQLFFGPETSTSNRCMIGGMVGNNACGAHSLIYGSTREHTLEVKGFLSDGSFVHFRPLSHSEFNEKCKLENLEGKIYRYFNELLSDANLRKEITENYPKKSIERRNTGYALDLLMDSAIFGESDKPFNLCKLIAGSEGTLAFITEIKLNLVDLPPPEKAVVAIHCNTIDEALHANLIALKYQPGAIEMIDRIILDCTKENIEQKQNRFFIVGDPGAIIIAEFERDQKEEIISLTEGMIKELKDAELGYAYPVIWTPEINKIWNLRKAGLGLLANVPGDAKPVSFIEDTAVDVNDLPAYIKDFDQMLAKDKLSCVYHAHVATGELHLRPLLNLKETKDVELFHSVGENVAKLVKKYNGSLSGEHGDGRLRGEFIPIMVGPKIYGIFEDVKKTWDSQNIFNPGKIVKTPKMNSFLRYEPGKETKSFTTKFNFEHEGGILRAAEKCNGSGDCRKTEISGGTMCPSYMATKDESATTRARANILRNFLTKSNKANPFAHDEVYQVMDLCLSCKGCKSECPSNVDVAKLKAEFLYQYYQEHGVPLRAKLFGSIGKLNKLNSLLPQAYNFFMKNPVSGKLIKKFSGVSEHRQLPLLSAETVSKWAKKFPEQTSASKPKKKIFLFLDEFTNYNDAEIGKKAVRLLARLGYQVEIPKHYESARSYISKGMLKEASQIAEKNIKLLSKIVTAESPLVGVEPSALLTFRDEYLSLAPSYLEKEALHLSENSFLVDEFIFHESKLGNISSDDFTSNRKELLLHGHCHQKALGSMKQLQEVLSLPKNYNVKLIPSGCCGMAGSFGYEKEHYETSMKVGELVLFPAIREAKENQIIIASGTSCRHQIKDGTEREALHPVEILYQALL